MPVKIRPSSPTGCRKSLQNELPENGTQSNRVTEKSQRKSKKAVTHPLGKM
jgi:hypothetical protein